NIEADHLEHYDGDFGKLKDAYAQFLSQIKPEGKAVVCADDPYLSGMLPKLSCETVTYGVDAAADFTASDLVLGDRKLQFSVNHKGRVLGTMKLSVPGRHNVYNA